MVSDMKKLIFISVVLLWGCDKQEKQNIAELLCFEQNPICQKQIDKNTVKFSISPENAPSEEKITVDLYFSNPVQQLQSRIEGRDMFMGMIPVQWKKLSSDHYQAQILYGACDSGSMIWRMSLEWSENKEIKTSFFDFESDRKKH